MDGGLILETTFLVCLELAFQARSAGVIYLHLNPGYQPLRDVPRLASLVQRIGLKGDHLAKWQTVRHPTSKLSVALLR